MRKKKMLNITPLFMDFPLFMLKVYKYIISEPTS